jgi:hypothetical protein
MVREGLAAFAAVCALLASGCASVGEFTPAAVRIGRVDFSETRDAASDAAPVRIALSRDRLGPDDALVASLIINQNVISRGMSVRVAVARVVRRVERPCDEARWPDLRNSRVDLRIDLRSAEPGTYAVVASVLPAGATVPLLARSEFMVEPAN